MNAEAAALAARIEDAVRHAADADAAMTQAVAMLERELHHYTWVGIYLRFADELVLGPFEGKPSPHGRIPLGRGICGAAATAKTTIVVDDVASDPRYLACSLETKSEIVVPILQDGRVLGEIDSDRSAAFGEADRRLVERVADALAGRMRAEEPIS